MTPGKGGDRNSIATMSQNIRPDSHLNLPSLKSAGVSASMH